MGRQPVKRTYRSRRRAEQAAETRRAIVDAARDLFVSNGYAGTTIAAVAATAGVSVPTVYAGFATKRMLLSAVIDVALTGDDEQVAVRDRPWVTEVRAERDQRQQLALIARNARNILGRAGPMHRVIREAAATDPAVAKLRDRHQRERLAGQTEFVRWVADRGTLRQGLTVPAAANTLWVLASPEVHDLLTRTLLWREDRYERWLTDALVSQLLPNRSERTRLA